MARRVETHAAQLADYEAIAHLAPAVRELRTEAELLVPQLEGRTVWMVNSTEHGGGVAEMLPTMVALLRELGVHTEWVILESDRPELFAFTKRLHNLIHGSGEARIDRVEREVYEAVNLENARQLEGWMSDGDILAVHDPQPLPLAGQLTQHRRIRTVWRCHIGLDENTPETRTAWSFLEPYTEPYDHAIFSAPEYIPSYLRTRASVVYPAIDPLGPKNRELSLHKLVGVLANSALAVNPGPVLTPPYPAIAERLMPDGTFRPANMSEDIGLLTRPIVTQISRWDRLKGWAPLMRAFAKLKSKLYENDGDRTTVHTRRLELVRLVLGGPDPASVADDPESREVLDDLHGIYADLPEHVQRDVALVSLPMADVRQNALMVNAIQRASSIVVQNSLREGFGLTVTEAMWKHVPVLSNRRACGPRQQVRDGLDGRLIGDAEDEDELAHALDEMLADPDCRARMGRSAQRRAHDEFMVFAQVRRWLELLSRL